MAAQTIVSSSAQSFILNGNMLGGLQIDNETGNFLSLAGGVSGTVGDTNKALNSDIHNNSIIDALNFVYDSASGNEPGGDANDIQRNNGAGGFAGGNAELTAAGALSGLTTVDGSGDLTMGSITMTGFTVDGDGDVVAKSLNNSSGGITNAGAIAGASSIDATGDLTVGSITMAEFAVDSSGNTDVDGTLNVQGVPTFQAGAVFSAGITTAGAIGGASTIAASGLASLDGGINVDDAFTVATNGATVISTLGSAGAAMFLSASVGKGLGESMGSAEMAKVPVFKIQGTSAAGQLREFSLAVSGGMLQVRQLA